MYTFKVIIIQDENGGYTASIPALQHCLSRGETIDEAIANVQEAMEGVIETMKAHGIAIPSLKSMAVTIFFFMQPKTRHYLYQFMETKIYE